MRLLSALLLALTIVACGGATKRPQTEHQSNTQIERILSQAKSESGVRKYELYLDAAALLVKTSRFDKAKEILAHIDPKALGSAYQNNFHVTLAKILLAEKQPEKALQELKKVAQLKQHSINWQVDYQQVLSETYFQLGNYFEAAKIRIELDDLITEQAELAANNEFIWQALNQMSAVMLEQMQGSLNDQRLNGWLEIVSINKKFASRPEQLIAAMTSWKQRYPLHPATVAQPKVLQKLAAAPVYKPTQIAVLLPLSGKLAAVGQMIADGIVAAHYAQQDADKAPKLKIYDTAKTLSIETSYQRAIDEGADFIIGPLTKENVATLLERTPEVPIFALNQLDENDLEVASSAYQFGLPIEDEAIQVAHRAWEMGHRKALIFVRDNSVGKRAEEAFKRYFEQLGGEVVTAMNYDTKSDYKKKVQELLRVDKSYQRHRQLENLLGRNIEFELRRRQDADFIFLYANATLGRRIKPFINYYYGHDLPVMATSEIYTGKVNPKADIDLNGIEFPDIPLLLSKQPKFVQLREHFAKIDDNIISDKGRFFALGFDAYQMLSELARLQAFPDYRWNGLSGELNVDENGKVHRFLTFARFNRGRPFVTKERELASKKTSPSTLAGH